MKKMLKFQITDLAKSFIIYFCIMVTITVIGIVFSFASGKLSFNVNFNGTGFSDIIFTFVIGLCMYKEHYFMAMQNGISRKSFYKSSLCVLSLLSFACALSDTLLVIIAEFLIDRFSPSFQILNIIQLIYSDFFIEKGAFTMMTVNLIFTFTITLMTASLGLLIASVFYRIQKKYRTIYVIILPLLFFFILPVFFTFFPALRNTVGTIFLTLMGLNTGAVNPLIGSITMLATFIILSICSYLFLRKTEI